MRRSRNMRPTWLTTNDLKERVPALTPTTRGLCHRLLGINHVSIKLPPLRPLSKRPQIPLPWSRDPLFPMKRTTMRLRLTKKTMRDYSSPASWRRLWEVTVTSRLRWPALCRLKKNKKGDVSSVSLQIT